MPPTESALKPLQECEQPPLAIAPSTKMLPGALKDDYQAMVDDGIVAMCVKMKDGRELLVDPQRYKRAITDAIVETEYEWAKDKLHTEQQGEKFTSMVARVNRKYPVGDDIYDKVEAIDTVLRKDEVERMREERDPMVQIGNTFEDGSVRMGGGNNSIGGTQHNL